MPRPDRRPPGSGDVLIPVSAQRPAGGKVRRYNPLVRKVVQSVWSAHPVSVTQARQLADIYGRGINGQRGTIATQATRNGVGASGTPAHGFTGYAQPAQLFAGWNPGFQTHVGTTLVTPDGLPSTAVPLGGSSPMDTAMAQIMAGQR